MLKKKLFITILLGVLTVSTFLNFYFLNKAKEMYVREQKLHLNPINKSSNVDIEIQSLDDSLSIILLGDSRIEGWRPEFAIKGVKLINYGIGGETTSQLLYRVEKEIDTYNSKIIIIQIGINDLKTLGVLENNKDEIISNCFNNIVKISTLLTSKNIQVVLLTIFPHGEVSFLRKFVWDDSITQAIEIVNKKIKIINLPNFCIIDCDSVLLGQNNLIKPEYSKDELHLNKKGYEVLNNILYPTISHLLKSNK